jgi:hypothetical protein
MEVQIVYLVFLISCKDCHFGLVVQVKAHLSVGEYKGFLECMRGLKNQTINMSNLLQLISNLFSAPERLFLLCRFIESSLIHSANLFRLLDEAYLHSQLSACWQQLNHVAGVIPIWVFEP